MAKNKGLLFTIFAALGALTGYATYMANQDEFSDDTKDKYDSFLNKAKNVSTDIQRTYTSIGDKREFEANTKNLGKNAKNLATDAGNLVVSATTDIYNSAKKNVSKAVKSFNESTKTASKKKATTPKKKASAKTTSKKIVSKKTKKK